MDKEKFLEERLAAPNDSDTVNQELGIQVLNSHVRLVPTLLDSADIEHLHHCRKLCWTTPV